MRLIDADALLESETEKHGRVPVVCTTTLNREYLDDVLDSHPTVDAVPVVRCGQCVWFCKGYCVNPTQDMIPVTAGHFCGYGKRKDGE